MTMKNLAISMALYGIALTIVHGEVKNGYDPEIKGMLESLKSLTALVNANNNLSLFQRAAMNDKINKLIEYISYYELTETLLHQFKDIAPAMYDEIDNLKDKTGQPVIVFVKFVPEEVMQHGAAGTTNLDHLANDSNIYQSEYGPHTVSVKIASVTKALILLAHEFGHSVYQVTHLSTYFEYYSMHYQNKTFNSKYIGHNSNDPSGQMAIAYESAFRDQYVNFLKDRSNKVENPFAFIQNMKKTFARMN